MESKQHSCFRGLWNLITVHYEGLILFWTPIALLPIVITNYEKANGCMYILLIMLIFWTFEVLPLGITSIIPVLAFPLMGILDTEQTCALYFQNGLVMFLTTIMIASAIEYSNLHKRLALRVIRAVGCSPRRLHFGVCMATSFMSLWIANSACTALMCPIIFAILDQLRMQGIIKQYHDDDMQLPVGERRPSDLASCFYLSVSFAASIGGCGSLIGTPTNLAMATIYDNRFPEATERITFNSFMAYALPPTIVSNIVMYLCMEWFFMGLFRPNSRAFQEANLGAEAETISNQVIQDKYTELGPMSTHETSVGLLFVASIFLYTFKQHVKSWLSIVHGCAVMNSVSAVSILILLFALPANYDFLRRTRAQGHEITPALLHWGFVCSKIPWGLIFLVGGGSVLSEGTNRSGMATKLGNALKVLEIFPGIVIVFIVTTIAVIMTNFTANVAICNILVPIVIEMAVALKVHPLSMVYPVGLGCSVSFLLPVGTPGNALIQGYANVSTKTMILSGTLPSVTTTILFWLFAETWGYVVYPNFSTYPAWADATPNSSKLMEVWED